MKPLLASFLIGFATFGASAAEVVQSVSLERTPCYGTCPVYKVTLTSTGEVTFEGRDFVENKGTFHAKIDPKRFAAVVDRLVVIGFWSLNDLYFEKILPNGAHQLVSDYPTELITVTSNLRQKTVQDYYGAPDSVTALEKYIDEIAGSKVWIGTYVRKHS